MAKSRIQRVSTAELKSEKRKTKTCISVMNLVVAKEESLVSD
jgi:hypothetical protein